MFDPVSGTLTINDLNFDSKTESLILDTLIKGSSGLKDISLIPDILKEKIGHLIKTRLLTAPLEKIAKERISKLDLPYVDIDSTKINLFSLSFDPHGLSVSFGKSILPLSILAQANTPGKDLGPSGNGLDDEGEKALSTLECAPEVGEALGTATAINDEPLPVLFPNSNGQGELKKLAGLQEEVVEEGLIEEIKAENCGAIL